jgi:PhzF family phenazine biosynthesis protein
MTKIFTVDSFADAPFRGNPAGVCPLDGPRDEAWMLAVAGEMKHSETAFFWPEGEALRLRWFTPEVEVDLCGHATLATSHILWEEGFLPPEREAHYLTRSGPLSAKRREGLIELDFPATVPEPAQESMDLAGALGAEILGLWRSRFDLLALLRDEAAVRGLAPDHRALRSLGLRGCIVTAQAETAGFDFVSRFFAPGVGIDEDPVTGSAHCALGPFWAERLDKSDLSAYQASKRGGSLRVRVAGDRVILGGKAVTVVKGELLA